jgi:hypothetical protein
MLIVSYQSPRLYLLLHRFMLPLDASARSLRHGPRASLLVHVRRIFPTHWAAQMPAAMKISMPVRIPKTTFDMRESRLLSVKDVEEYSYA